MSRPDESLHYWRNEVSGRLAHAVMAYLDEKPMSREQLAIFRSYLDIWIHAPCWLGPEPELGHLRSTVSTLDSAAAIRKWLDEALDICIDPL